MRASGTQRLGVFGLALAGGVVVTAPACSNGVDANSGLDEPIQVSGQFISGSLPTGTARTGKLSVTSIIFQNPRIVSGLAGTSVSGLVTNDAASVGVQLTGKGTGYWVVPVQGPDSQSPGQNDFGFSLGVKASDSPGLAQLSVVAIGADGTAGQVAQGALCIESRVPDNGHACNPKAAVPRAVFSLRWDTNFDVDLHVITPAGRDVNAKTAITSVALDAGPPGPTVGVIDRDSLGNCAVDGWRQEDLVYQDAPPKGTYLIYAAPFSACGQTAVRFVLDIYEPGPDGNLHSTFTRVGELLSNDVTGGTSPGLFVAQRPSSDAG